jgi:CheY-like chemotaxis protein
MAGKVKNRLNILYAEDDFVNFKYFEALFKSFKNCDAKGFFNGKDLLNEFKKCPKNYDLIVLDIQMPEMNGVECITEIKKIRPKIPVLAITAFALKEDVEKFVKFNFDKYITKPVSKFELERIINSYLPVVNGDYK